MPGEHDVVQVFILKVARNIGHMRVELHIRRQQLAAISRSREGRGVDLMPMLPQKPGQGAIAPATVPRTMQEYEYRYRRTLTGMSGIEPAIHAQHLAGDFGGTWAAEKKRQRGDVFGAWQAESRAFHSGFRAALRGA